MDNETEPRLPRREVLKWFAASAVLVQFDPLGGLPLNAQPALQGYGTDPDVTGHYAPGDFWPLTLTPSQRQIVTALADLILPKDHLGPSASEVRVPDYIDEWVSAPYAAQRAHRDTLLPGIQWLEDESNRRFQSGFASLRESQMRSLVDDICWPADAKPEHKKAAGFFQLFRNLAAGAYYATEPGWKAIGYVGNEALVAFNGPPQEVLDRLGVEQTVQGGPVVETGGFE